MASPGFGKRKEFLAASFLLAMTVSSLVLAVKPAPLLRAGYQDFTIFYSAARLVRSGQSHSLYHQPAQYRAQQEFAPNVLIRQAALPYNHPPFEALLFVPFTFISFLHAYLLWNALNLSMITAGLMLLRKQFVEIRNLPLSLVVLLATGFVPIARALMQGQDSILLLFLFVVALAALEDGHEAVAGSVLALGLFKFQMVLPLVFLLAARRWRLLLGFVPVTALLVGISLAMVGWHGAVGYAQLLLHLESTGTGGAVIANMPNLRGIIASLAPARDPASLVPFTILGSTVIIAIAFWRMRRTADSVRFAFILATVTAILVSYHALTHDLSLLLPVVVLLFVAPGPESGGEARIDSVLLVLLYLALFLQPLWPHVNQFCWPILILIWFFRKRGRVRSPESVA